jgi:hypothetical protein
LGKRIPTRPNRNRRFAVVAIGMDERVSIRFLENGFIPFCCNDFISHSILQEFADSDTCSDIPEFITHIFAKTKYWPVNYTDRADVLFLLFKTKKYKCAKELCNLFPGLLSFGTYKYASLRELRMQLIDIGLFVTRADIDDDPIILKFWESRENVRVCAIIVLSRAPVIKIVRQMIARVIWSMRGNPL